MFAGVISGLVFTATALLALSLQRQAKELRQRRQALAVARMGQASGRRPGGTSLKQAFFAVLPQLAARQAAWVPKAWGARVAKLLAREADWRGRGAAEWLAAKELAALFGALFGAALGGDLLLTLGLAAGAFFLPDLWLAERDRERRRQILRGLPEMLDLLASCMEAGLGFEQALAVIQERGRRGALQDELAEMTRTLRMGLSRRDALQAMARRVDEQEFTTFVTALIQAERLGVSIGETLKLQAAQMRGKRAQRVEKQALEAPVKLLFPLIVFIFPVVFLVLFGPIIVRFLQGF